MSERNLVIVFALFPGVTQLDFTGPHQVFSSLPGSEVIVASVAGGTIESSGGLTFAGLQRLADISACDVLCVPGGRGVTDNAIHDEAFLGELRRLAATAQFVTSVRTGSIALGAAGLLRGKRAACHWAWRDTLALFGAIPGPRPRRSRRQRRHWWRRHGRHRFRVDPGGRNRRTRGRAGDPASDRVRAVAALRCRSARDCPARDPGASSRPKRRDGDDPAKGDRSGCRPARGALGMR
jgi:putative intracellular protease/amidase